MHVVGPPEGEARAGAGKTQTNKQKLEEIMTEKSPDLVKTYTSRKLNKFHIG